MAVAQARVRVIGIAIVAGLKAIGFGSEVRAAVPIAATADTTVGEAAVAVDLVTVVAGLADADSAIAADGDVGVGAGQ